MKNALAEFVAVSEPPSFVGTAQTPSAPLPVLGEARALGRYFRDKNAPWFGKAFLLAAVVYILLPADAVPDIAPVVGWLDDLGVGLLAVAHLMRTARRYRDR